MRQRILLQRPLIAWISSAILVCPRRSRLSSVTALTSRPFGYRNQLKPRSFVRCQICCLSRASGVIDIVLVCQVFRLVRSWLFCNSRCGFRLFVARFWYVEVFAAVPHGVFCFLSCWVGRYFAARWNAGAQAGCFDAAFGYRRPPRHARTARAPRVGSQWPGCKCQEADFFWCFQNRRALPRRLLNI